MFREAPGVQLGGFVSGSQGKIALLKLHPGIDLTPFGEKKTASL
jgi:hypothetical protein